MCLLTPGMVCSPTILTAFVSPSLFCFDITTDARFSAVLLCHYHVYVSMLISSCPFLVSLCGFLIDY